MIKLDAVNYCKLFRWNYPNYKITQNWALNFVFLWCNSFSELVPEPVPYLNQTFRSKFSKTTRQKFKMYIHFYRTYLALSHYSFTFSFCRIVVEKFGFKFMLRYGTCTVREQVSWNYCRTMLLEVFEISLKKFFHFNYFH